MSMHFKASIYCTNDSYGGIQQLPNTVAKLAVAAEGTSEWES